MSISIYTYGNPYEINTEPYWESIKNSAHFCVSQTMVNGLHETFEDLQKGQLATVDVLVKQLYPSWNDTKTYIEQYAAVSEVIKNADLKYDETRNNKIKKSLKFSRKDVLDCVRLLFEMGIEVDNINTKLISFEQQLLVATYRKIKTTNIIEKFKFDDELRKSASIEEYLNNAIRSALMKKAKSEEIEYIENINLDTIVIHGIHQFTPTILSAIEILQKYKRVVLMFNYQEQYKEVYQTWVDIYSCFDVRIMSPTNDGFKPSAYLIDSYPGNKLADDLGRIVNGHSVATSTTNDITIIEFDNVTEFSAYIANIYEDAYRKYDRAGSPKNRSILSYMSEHFYSANNDVNEILKIYFPDQFGERHFLAYPIGHFFMAIINLWDSENKEIVINNMDDIAECLCSEALPITDISRILSTFKSTKIYFSHKNTFKEIIGQLKNLKRDIHKINKSENLLKTKLNRLCYFNVSEEDVGELIHAMTLLNKCVELFCEEFEENDNQFKKFYENVRHYIENQILPSIEVESEFRDLIERLLDRLSDSEELTVDGDYDCLKETIHYYLKQRKSDEDAARWIVRDFQQIDGDILMSMKQAEWADSPTYHFACVSDSDMNVKKDELFPWPLDMDFFEKACEPLDWKYYVFVTSRREYKHFKRYALIYGLEFNRCKVKISYVKTDGENENELYYLLKMLNKKIEPYDIDPTHVTTKNVVIKKNYGHNQYSFNNYDVFKKRICPYRFALDSILGNGTVYQDEFLINKYYEILVINDARRILSGAKAFATESIIDTAIDTALGTYARYFPFIGDFETKKIDIKSNAKNYLKEQVLENGKKNRFEPLTPRDYEHMNLREEFVYLKITDDYEKNILQDKFAPVTDTDVKILLSNEFLLNEEYEKIKDEWCKWCSNKNICLEQNKAVETQ